MCGSQMQQNMQGFFSGKGGGWYNNFPFLRLISPSLIQEFLKCTIITVWFWVWRIDTSKLFHFTLKKRKKKRSNAEGYFCKVMYMYSLLSECCASTNNPVIMHTLPSFLNFQWNTDFWWPIIIQLPMKLCYAWPSILASCFRLSVCMICVYNVCACYFKA